MLFLNVLVCFYLFLAGSWSSARAKNTGLSPGRECDRKADSFGELETETVGSQVRKVKGHNVVSLGPA